MALIRDGAFVPDAWVRVDAHVPLPESGDLIVPLARIGEVAGAWPNDRRVGVHVECAVAQHALRPHLLHLALISIGFPSFVDGRGFSVARSLRLDGFSGTLRAFGSLIADQLAHGRSCGFDEIEIPDALGARQLEAQWRTAGSATTVAYQRGYGGSPSILERRHASLAQQHPGASA